MKFMTKYKNWLIISVSLLVILSFYHYILKEPKSSELISSDNEDVSFTLEDEEDQPTEEIEVKVESSMIVIDIKGAIEKPGVYEMEADTRVHQLIKRAGGVKKGADELAVNLAAPLEDGMVVYIPTKGENIELDLQMSTNKEMESEQININTASSEELQNLSGIGPSKAEAIIAYREENGLFQAPEGLLDVSGIGEKSLEKIKDQITIK